MATDQRNQEATLYVGNLSDEATEDILWELMVQAAPVVSAHIPRDKVMGTQLSYGFVEFKSEEGAEYALKVMNMTKLFGKPLKVNRAAHDKKIIDIGANLFLGNLAPEVDEKLLFDTFSAFGSMAQTPKIMVDPDSLLSRGFGFVSYDSFEASDLAIECMNGQFLAGREISVQYAFKKDAPGERHGDHAERMLAANQPQQGSKPNVIFSGGGENRTTIIPPPVPSQTYPVGLVDAPPPVPQMMPTQNQFAMGMPMNMHLGMAPQMPTLPYGGAASGYSMGYGQPPMMNMMAPMGQMGQPMMGAMGQMPMGGMMAHMAPMGGSFVPPPPPGPPPPPPGAPDVTSQQPAQFIPPPPPPISQ
jgi:splicing factor 3B subunit 4